MASQREFNWPINPTTVNSGPIEFLNSSGVPTVVSPTTPLPVDGSGTIQPVSGTVAVSNFPATQPISAVSLPLPTGAATSANQTTEIAALDAIETAVANIPPQGQALAADSTPVVLPVDQITALTPPTTVTVTQATGTNLHTVVDSSALPSGAATSALQTQISNQLPASLGAKATAASLAVNIASDQVVPVSATTLPLPTGAATSALQTTGNTSLATIAAAAGKQPINTNGSYAEIVNLTTTAQNFTAPTNAVGFVIEALSDNSNNIRYKMGATATTTSGMRLEPGRSENYNSGPAMTISVIAESGTTQIVAVQWILSS